MSTREKWGAVIIAGLLLACAIALVMTGRQEGKARDFEDSALIKRIQQVQQK